MAKKVTAGDNEYHIFRLRLRPQRWVDTGVLVDGRDSTRQDVLSTGSRLFIASHKYVGVSNFASSPMPGDQMRLYRFSYSAGLNKYTLEGTAVINEQKSETLVIDRDSNGAIWATWVQEDSGGTQHHVYVNKSNGDCVGGAMSTSPRLLSRSTTSPQTTSRRSFASEGTRSACCGATRAPGSARCDSVSTPTERRSARGAGRKPSSAVRRNRNWLTTTST
jgi:hypothetical protein